MAQFAGLNTTGKKRFPVGHTGTLDPLATGLLILLLGSSTKKAPELTKLDKVYEVTMRLGQTSTTGDNEGNKVVVTDRQPTNKEIKTALLQFTGDLMQRPPIFSAIKVNGQRAYKLARAGKTPELEARPVHIERSTLNNYKYPEVTITVHVSSGTYIRSLVEDIGTTLGTGAYISALRRVQVGPFVIADAVPIQELTPELLARKV